MLQRNSLSRTPRRGHIIAFVAISLMGILGVIALAVDGGLMFSNRRAVQCAADAAALAAAIQMYQDYPSQTGGTQGMDPSGTAAASAISTAKDNGYAGGKNGVTVAVNIPPTSGNNANTPGYAEVIITMKQNRLFSSIFGSGKLSVQGRAVARGSQTPPGIGILVLDPSANNAFQMSGTGSVNVTNGSVVVDSTSSTGLHLSASGSLTADVINTHTTSSPGYSATASGTVNGTMNFNQPVTPDPLASFASSNTPSTSGVVDYGSCSLQNPTYVPGLPSPLNNLKGSTGQQYGVMTSATSATIYPGYYSGNLTINHNINDGFTITMQSGVYIMDGNVTFNGYGTINSGNGGTLWYQKSGAVTNSSQNVTINLSPMSSGTYSNPAIAIWQDKNDTSNFNFSNGGNLNLTTGIIYIPKALLQLSAKAGTTSQAGSEIIVNTLALTNSGSINVNVGSPTVPGRQLFLTE